MTDTYDPFGPASFAKPKRGRLPEPTPPVEVEPDPFASPPADCRLSALPTNDGITPLRAAPRRPKLSLVHGQSSKAKGPAIADDPFGVSLDRAELPPPPRLPDNRRCGLDDPFGPALQLPFVVVSRDWDGGLRLRVLGVAGPLEQRSLRTADELLAAAEAEQVAIRHEAMLVVGIQSSFTVTSIESAIAATAAAMKGAA